MNSGVYFINPINSVKLIKNDGFLVQEDTKAEIAKIVDGIPRFVDLDNYADSFGWQWNKWEHVRSKNRGSNLKLKELILRRTRFDKFDLTGKTLLECGMGGGDDTEVLLSLPFSEIHSFDFSNSVDRANRFLKDPRLTISQASIFDIPYPDEAFDVVYCHRVLQHTPDPVNALDCICKKVKPGGILFAHAYKRSTIYMSEWRYKYRWMTKHLPHRFIYFYVQVFGRLLHEINNVLYKHRIGRKIAFRFIPFYYKSNPEMPKSERLELEKLITFDALTPKHDHPMTSDDFFGTIIKNGFDILYKDDPATTPLCCTAVKRS